MRILITVLALSISVAEQNNTTYLQNLECEGYAMHKDYEERLREEYPDEVFERFLEIQTLVSKDDCQKARSGDTSAMRRISKAAFDDPGASMTEAVELMEYAHESNDRRATLSLAWMIGNDDYYMYDFHNIERADALLKEVIEAPDSMEYHIWSDVGAAPGQILAVATLKEYAMKLLANSSCSTYQGTTSDCLYLLDHGYEQAENVMGWDYHESYLYASSDTEKIANLEKSIEWFKIAADKGDTEALDMYNKSIEWRDKLLSD